MSKLLSFKASVLFSSFTLLLTACGGSDTPKPVVPPVASVSLSSERGNINEAVTLNASGSTANNGQISQWVWTVEIKPVGSEVEAPAAIAMSRFTPDVVGDYRICLSVRDELARSQPDCHQFTAINPKPTASSRTAISTTVSNMIQLDALESLPPTGGDTNLLSYQWTLQAKPENSTAELDNANLAQPRFTADLAGEYRLNLVVSYQGLLSEPLTVVVTASAVNAVPMPQITLLNSEGNVITDQQLASWVLGDEITLSAASSTDADGDELEYHWVLGAESSVRVQVLPSGSRASLTSLSGTEVKFTPDVLGDFSVMLAAFDGKARTTEGVRIRVNQLPAKHVNQSPVAGLLGPVEESLVNSEGKIEFELGGEFILPSPFVPGIGTYDIDTFPNAIGELSYKYTLLARPDSYDLSNAILDDPFFPSIKFTTEGDYQLQMRVCDQGGAGLCATDTKTFTARTGANLRPKVSAELAVSNGAVLVGQTITFDGSNSSDPNDNQLSYDWVLFDKPVGSEAVLNNATTATPSLVADKAGAYIAGLIVTDSHGANSGHRVHVLATAKTENNVPQARLLARASRLNGSGESLHVYSSEQPFIVYPETAKGFENNDDPTSVFRRSSNNQGIYLGANAFDADADTMTYIWNLVQEPTSNSMRLTDSLCNNGMNGAEITAFKTAQARYEHLLSLRQWTCENVTISPSLPGDYRMELLVSDGIDIAGPYNLVVPVVERSAFPTLLLEQITGTKENYVGRQKVLPFSHVVNGATSNKLITPNSSFVYRTYSLTAFDQDYTVNNLTLRSQTDFGAEIEGLTEGDVIKQGDTRIFNLVISTPEIISVNQFNPDNKQLGEQNMVRDLEWSFGFTEKSKWTFSVKPKIRNDLK